MNHYVCEECGGVAHEEGSCQTEGCAKKGSPLMACTCEDGSHTGSRNGGAEVSSEAKPEEETEGGMNSAM